MKQFLLILIFTITSLSLFANNDALWQEANTAYQAGNYKTAVEKYESILATGAYSKELHYNLGNSYFKNKQKGKSVLHLEKALLLSPRDADIQFNLALVNRELEDDIEVLPQFFLTAGWSSFHQLLSSTLWGLLSILLLAIGVAGIAQWLLSVDRAKKKQGFIGGITMILISFLFLALARSQSIQEQDSQTAIIVQAEVSLLSSAEANSKEILKLHEGTKVSLLDKIGDWYKIRIANGEQGWLEQNAFEKI